MYLQPWNTNSLSETKPKMSSSPDHPQKYPQSAFGGIERRVLGMMSTAPQAASNAMLKYQHDPETQANGGSLAMTVIR
jgi:hypothetical protein